MTSPLLLADQTPETVATLANMGKKIELAKGIEQVLKKEKYDMHAPIRWAKHLLPAEVGMAAFTLATKRPCSNSTIISTRRSPKRKGAIYETATRIRHFRQLHSRSAGASRDDRPARQARRYANKLPSVKHHAVAWHQGCRDRIAARHYLIVGRSFRLISSPEISGASDRYRHRGHDASRGDRYRGHASRYRRDSAHPPDIPPRRRSLTIGEVSIKDFS